MKFTARINILPHDGLLDPAGKATEGGLHNLGFTSFEQVRIGKRIELTLDAPTEAAAREQVEAATKKLLANLIMERYQIEVSAAK
jgi:phosphoribosylformylglycinamidine synthase